MHRTRTTALASILLALPYTNGLGSTASSGLSGVGTSDTLYFITNDPQANNIIAISIDADGDMNFTGFAPAGGVNTHAVVDPAGPIAPGRADATNSQGIVQVHQQKGLLATVNTVNNTVVLFKIDPVEPGSLTMLGEPIFSGGTFPNSVVFNQAGDRLCVLNSGSINGVACFGVTGDGLVAQTDSIRELGLNQTTPATGPFGSASQIGFTRDEKNLVVTVKRPFEDIRPGFLAVWSVDEGGNLAANYTSVPTPSGGGAPFSFSHIRGADALFATDFAVGVDIFDFSHGVLGVNESSRTTAVSIDGQVASCWSTYSPSLDRYYSVDVVQNTITEFEVDANLTASVVTSFDASLGPIDSVAVDIGNHSYLYTLLAGSLQIGTWKLDTDSGPLEQKLLNLSVVVPEGVPITVNFTQGLAVYKGMS